MRKHFNVAAIDFAIALARRFVSFAIAALLAGCATRAIDVGSNQPDEDAGSLGPVDEDGWPVESACARGAQLPIVGTWDGWLEVKRFPSGSDAIRLVITHANADHVCGTITLGQEQPPWPPVNDPQLPYPEDFRLAANTTFSGFVSSIEGRPVTLIEGNFSGTRLQFRTAYAQWRSWCALQASYSADGHCNQAMCVPSSCTFIDGGFSVLRPNVRSVGNAACAADYPDGTRHIDCMKAALCVDGPCKCSDSRCWSPPKLSAGRFDFRVNGDYLDGSLLGVAGPAEPVPYRIHLTRSR